MFLEFLWPLFWVTFIDLFIFQRLFFSSMAMTSSQIVGLFVDGWPKDLIFIGCGPPNRNTGKWRFIGIPYRWSLFLGGGRDELDKHSHWDLWTMSSPDIPILESPNWLNFEPMMLSLFGRESPVVLQRNNQGLFWFWCFLFKHPQIPEMEWFIILVTENFSQSPELHGAWCTVYIFPWCCKNIPILPWDRQPLCYFFDMCLDDICEINVCIVLLMEEILHQLGCVKPCKQWDKLPTSTDAGFPPSTVWMGRLPMGWCNDATWMEFSLSARMPYLLSSEVPVPPFCPSKKKTVVIPTQQKDTP